MGRLLYWGTLCGLGYTFETPTGGLLGLATVALCFWRRRRVAGVVLIGLAALPWAALHHGICYSFAGTWKPVNTVVEYFDYPDSEFSRDNLTGFWNHKSAGDFVVYAFGLLFGNRGFLQANLPLFLAPIAAVVLLRRRVPEVPQVVFCCGWAVAVWLLYATLSMNYAGTCCSIRWLVPLLAPAYCLLALLLREGPRYRHDFFLLSACGLVLIAVWTYAGGTWEPIPPLYWPIQGLSLAVFLGGSRLLPAPPAALPRLPWMAVGLISLGAIGAVPLLAERRPLGPVVHPDVDWTINGTAVLSVAVGAVIGLRAWADRRECNRAAWRTLGLAALAALLVTVQTSLAPSGSAIGQLAPYRMGLNRVGPYGTDLLAIGFVRSVEWLTADESFADLAARWFITFWLLWCCFRLARRFHAPPRAALCLAPLALVLTAEAWWSPTPLSLPLSGLLVVVALLAVFENWPLCTALALALALLARGSALAFLPLFLLCGRGRRQEWAMVGVALVWLWSLWESMRRVAGPLPEPSQSPWPTDVWAALVVAVGLLPSVLANVRRAPRPLSLLALLLAGLTVLGVWLVAAGILPGGPPPLAPLTVVLAILAVPPSAKNAGPEVRKPGQ